MDIVLYLVSEQGCNTACQNNDGNTPLHVACHEGYVDIVRYLVGERECSTSLRVLYLVNELATMAEVFKEIAQQQMVGCSGFVFSKDLQ